MRQVLLQMRWKVSAATERNELITCRLLVNIHYKWSTLLFCGQ